MFVASGCILQNTAWHQTPFREKRWFSFFGLYISQYAMSTVVLNLTFCRNIYQCAMIWKNNKSSAGIRSFEALSYTVQGQGHRKNSFFMLQLYFFHFILQVRVASLRFKNSELLLYYMMVKGFKTFRAILYIVKGQGHLKRSLIRYFSRFSWRFKRPWPSWCTF